MATLQEQQTIKQLIPRALRFQISTAMRYRIAGDKIWREGWVENISVTGMLFSTAELIEAGKSIDVRLVLPGKRLGGVGGTMVSKGRVVRSWPIRDTFHHALVATALVAPRLLRLRQANEQV